MLPTEAGLWLFLGTLEILRGRAAQKFASSVSSRNSAKDLCWMFLIPGGWSLGENLEVSEIGIGCSLVDRGVEMLHFTKDDRQKENTTQRPTFVR